MRKWECTVCGYIHVGEEPPDECPVCSADKSLFVEITEEASSSAPSRLPSPEARPTFLTTMQGFVSRMIVKHHLHPIAVHTPNGVLPMALFFLLIALLFGLPLFEVAAFYSCLFVLLFMPVVLFTGLEIWKNRYHGALTPIFKIKISAALISVPLLLALVIWRVIQPGITSTVPGKWIYAGLALLVVLAVGLAGHMGGKLVFGARNAKKAAPSD